MLSVSVCMLVYLGNYLSLRLSEDKRPEDNLP